jgi:3-hydroxyanthranilate 3,4-dioxygenase
MKMSGLFEALNFKAWIDENRHLLKPPVGNKMIWPNRDFIVMVVGGPNERTDFHVNQGEEFFYQLEGDMTLKVIDAEGKIRDIRISAGDIYLLPPNTPHSPQRPANTVGMVIESRRREGQLDRLQWYCEQCFNKLYEEAFHLTNIETQFQAVFQRYYDSEHTRCKSCGHVNGRKWTGSPEPGIRSQ